VSEEVTLQEIIAQNQLLKAENERQSLEIKLLKEKVDLLIRRLFGSKSEKLDAAQLELLLKEAESGKADASAERRRLVPASEVRSQSPNVLTRTSAESAGQRIWRSNKKSSTPWKSEKIRKPSAGSEKKSPRCLTISRQSFSDVRSFGASSCVADKMTWLR
jgi:hypothetical protein